MHCDKALTICRSPRRGNFLKNNSDGVHLHFAPGEEELPMKKSDSFMEKRTRQLGEI